MGRPPKNKQVYAPPCFQSFKPAGIPRSMLERISLGLGEFEAIRLADHEGLDHKDAAERMGISRPTFTRLIEKARQKVARALVQGQELFVEGGQVHFENNLFRCRQCGHLVHLRMNEDIPAECPECGNQALIDMARLYGHGPCCGRGRRFRGGRGG